jgi:hypothetical protein
MKSAVPSPRTTAGGYMAPSPNVQRTAPLSASSAREPDTVATMTAPPPSATTSSHPL